MTKEDTKDEIKGIVRRDIVLSDKMTSLLEEHDPDVIEVGTREVLKEVVPELENPRRKLVALVTCKNIAEKIESEELYDMCVGNIERWSQKHG